MEKIVIWYFLSLKESLKKRSTWMWMLGMLFLLWVVAGISIPDYNNMKVGVCSKDSLYAQAVKKDLFSNENSFQFVEFDKEEDLEKAVFAGTLDCGFIFSKYFDKLIVEQHIEEAILYVSTPFSSKGDVAKEKVYAAVFKLYSEEILKKLETDVFGEHNEKRMTDILEKNKEYLRGTEIFQMQITPVNSNQKETDFNENNRINRYDRKIKSSNGQMDSGKGLVGLGIFLTMFLSYGSASLKEGDHVEVALSRKERFLYRYVKMLAGAFLPAVLGIILLLQKPSLDGKILKEICFLVMYLLLNAMWINVVGKLLGRAEQLPLWLVSLGIVHVIICPVVFDFAVYIPAIKGLRFLLPLNVYLRGF